MTHFPVYKTRSGYKRQAPYAPFLRCAEMERVEELHDYLRVCVPCKLCDELHPGSDMRPGGLCEACFKRIRAESGSKAYAQQRFENRRRY